jgi:hypothetical protein
LTGLPASSEPRSPPPHRNECPDAEPGQNKWIEHNARDCAPVHHEEDSSPNASAVRCNRAIKLPSRDPGFAPGRQQTADGHPTYRGQEGETLPAFDSHVAPLMLRQTVFGNRPAHPGPPTSHWGHSLQRCWRMAPVLVDDHLRIARKKAGGGFGTAAACSLFADMNEQAEVRRRRAAECGRAARIVYASVSYSINVSRSELAACMMAADR